MGCSRSHASTGDLLVLWQDVTCSTPCPLLSAKWFSPSPSLAGDNGASLARFDREVWGPFYLAGAEGRGYRLCWLLGAGVSSSEKIGFRGQERESCRQWGLE